MKSGIYYIKMTKTKRRLCSSYIPGLNLIFDFFQVCSSVGSVCSKSHQAINLHCFRSHWDFSRRSNDTRYLPQSFCQKHTIVQKVNKIKTLTPTIQSCKIWLTLNMSNTSNSYNSIADVYVWRSWCGRFKSSGLSVWSEMSCGF